MTYASRITENKGCVYKMEHAGFEASLMKAERLVGDRTFGLPPGVRIPIYPIAALPGCPEDWVREAGTYVCPVDGDWGLWFDWTMNDNLNTAVLPSVKGMNPITGQKIEGFGLEQYADKCPVHATPFAHGRLCEECGYEWPPQNYVCAPNTLWWDGFRQPDGSVRQFFFTEDDERDVASAVIGKENTVPAFGFAFYKPKNPRTPPRTMTRGATLIGCKYPKKMKASKNYGGGSSVGGQTIGNSYEPTINVFYQSAVSSSSPSDGVSLSSSSDVLNFCESAEPEQLTRGGIKEVSVGAGAKINQSLQTDSLGLKGWQEEQSAVIRLYFCFENQFCQIVERGGVKELASNKEGYLKGVQVG